MVLVEGVARPFGPEHAVDSQLRVLCTEIRARYAFPSMPWAEPDSTICPDCLDVVTTPGFDGDDGDEAVAPPIEAAEVEATVTPDQPAEPPAGEESAEEEPATPALSPALQQLYASPLWQSYVQQLEQSASSESNV